MGAFRFLLAASVAVAHAGFEHLHWGPISIKLDSALAIKCFFVISGFYMAMLLDGAYKNRPASFYANRALRIYPMYWLIALVTIGYEYAHGIARDLALAPTILLFGGQYYPMDRADMLAVAPAWTLGVELMFYALAPLLAKRSSLFLLVLAVVLARLKGGDLYSWIGQLPLFIVGMLIYRAKFIPSYKSTVDRWLGELSYPLYLAHYPIIMAMMDRPIHALALSVVVAIALKYALEPLELLRSRVRAGQPAPHPSAIPASGQRQSPGAPSHPAGLVSLPQYRQ